MMWPSHFWHDCHPVVAALKLLHITRPPCTVTVRQRYRAYPIICGLRTENAHKMTSNNFITIPSNSTVYSSSRKLEGWVDLINCDSISVANCNNFYFIYYYSINAYIINDILYEYVNGCIQAAWERAKLEVGLESLLLMCSARCQADCRYSARRRNTKLQLLKYSGDCHRLNVSTHHCSVACSDGQPQHYFNIIHPLHA